MNKIANDVLRINRVFYEIFAAGDYAEMKKLWANGKEVSVIHPGSMVLHGHEAVMMSWQQILENSGGSKIRCVEPRVYILGDTAYVICNEVFPEGQLIATNIFVLEEGAWRMVHHQAGPVNQPMQNISDSTKSIH